jgi:hypothetical protein
LKRFLKLTPVALDGNEPRLVEHKQPEIELAADRILIPILTCTR